MLVLAVGGYVIAYSIWYVVLPCGFGAVDQVNLPFALLMSRDRRVIAGAIFLNERVSLVSVMGGTIVIAGLAFAVLEPASVRGVRP